MSGARDDYIFMSLVLFTISTTWSNDIDNNHSVPLIIDKQCWAGNLANADKWKIAFAILVAL